jgi:hypothetical protein
VHEHASWACCGSATRSSPPRVHSACALHQRRTGTATAASAATALTHPILAVDISSSVQHRHDALQVAIAGGVVDRRLNGEGQSWRWAVCLRGRAPGSYHASVARRKRVRAPPPTLEAGGA